MPQADGIEIEWARLQPRGADASRSNCETSTGACLITLLREW